MCVVEQYEVDTDMICSWYELALYHLNPNLTGQVMSMNTFKIQYLQTKLSLPEKSFSPALYHSAMHPLFLKSPFDS